jgi:hypothetical protein
MRFNDADMVCVIKSSGVLKNSLGDLTVLHRKLTVANLL